MIIERLDIEILEKPGKSIKVTLIQGNDDFLLFVTFWCQFFFLAQTVVLHLIRLHRAFCLA